ncbi:6889_t:CDS:2, partial [Gigaspora rosea]
MKLNLFLVASFFIVLIGSATAINDENRQLFKRQSSLGKSCTKDADCAPDGGCSFEIGTCFLNNGKSCKCQSSDNRDGGTACAASAACKSGECDFSTNT